MSDLTKGPWVACVSSSDDFDICTAIKDKGNGNCIVANEIDEDYELLLLALPDMYESIESDVIRLEFDLAQIGDGFAHIAEEINAELNVKRKILAKARGEL